MRLQLLALLALSACSAPEPTYAGPPIHDDAPVSGPPRLQVEQGLGLEVRRASTDDYEDGRDPKLFVELVNRSRKHAYPIVLSTTAATSRGASPTSITRSTGERPARAGNPFAEEQTRRCGVYARDWARDLWTLHPGERVALEWFGYGSRPIGEDVARVRIVAHDAYGDVGSKLDRARVPPALWGMPRYAIASAPIELEVARPFTLRLELKGPLPTSPGASLAPHVAVTLTNRSTVPRAFAMPEDGSQLLFELEGVDAAGRAVECRVVSPWVVRPTSLP